MNSDSWDFEVCSGSEDCGKKTPINVERFEFCFRFRSTSRAEEEKPSVWQADVLQLSLRYRNESNEKKWKPWYNSRGLEAIYFLGRLGRVRTFIPRTFERRTRFSVTSAKLGRQATEGRGEQANDVGINAYNERSQQFQHSA